MVVCCDMMSRGHLFPTCWTRKEKKGKHTVAVVVLKRTWALHKNKKDKEERQDHGEEVWSRKRKIQPPPQITPQIRNNT